MLVFFHVLCALGSMLSAGLAYVRPSRRVLRLSSGLVALTLGSGTFLVLSRHVGLISVCLSGLVYLAVVSAELFLARRRLVEIPADMGH